MGFTQEKKINLDSCEFCLGCEEHCELGFVIDCFPQLPTKVYPTIGGERVKWYLSKEGQPINASEKDMRGLYGYELFERRMRDKAREIATLCDKYKTR